MQRGSGSKTRMQDWEAAPKLTCRTGLRPSRLKGVTGKMAPKTQVQDCNKHGVRVEVGLHTQGWVEKEGGCWREDGLAGLLSESFGELKAGRSGCWWETGSDGQVQTSTVAGG